MGKKDLCSQKGLEARRKGIKKESSSTKCCYLWLFISAAVTFLVIGSIHASRSSNAEKIHKEFGDSNPFIDNIYNTCNIPYYKEDPDIHRATFFQQKYAADDYCEENMQQCLEKGTGWAGMWAFNGSIMIIQAINFIAMACGAYYWWPRLLGTLCNCCLSCVHLSAWIVIFSARFSPLGNYCAINIAPIQLKGDTMDDFDDEWTYQSEGGLMIIFGVIQALLFLCQCFCWCPLYRTP